MLKYIVYVVSRKSFNPLAISDKKKAHRLNGNINYSEAAKLLEENTHSFGRDHFCNYCLHNAGKFSCAVDCFLDLCYDVFYNHLKLYSTTRNGFFDIIYESRNQRENLGAIEIVRDPVWLHAHFSNVLARRICLTIKRFFD